MMPLMRVTFRDLEPLIDWEGNERCGFLIGDGKRIMAIWPTPSLSPSPSSYSIGYLAWREAKARARKEGVLLMGSIHTHTYGDYGPSKKDLRIARRLDEGDYRAVWHIRSGTVTLYDRSGILYSKGVRNPLWLRRAARRVFI